MKDLSQLSFAELQVLYDSYGHPAPTPYYWQSQDMLDQTEVFRAMVRVDKSTRHEDQWQNGSPL